MPPLIPLLLILAASGSATVQEDSCQEKLTSFREVYFRTRSDGASARAPLIVTAQRLIDEYARTAPQCAGSVYESLVYLYVLEEEHPAAERTIRAYLRDVDQRATPRSQIAMRIQLGYVLHRLGQTMASGEAYYDAASRANHAPAYFGTRALIRSSMTARSMGDFDIAEAYVSSALKIIQDSVETNPELAYEEGEAMLTLSFLILERIDQGDATAPRDSLIARLDQVSADAVSILVRTQARGDRQSLALTAYAMAAALAGRPDIGLDRLEPAYALARSPGGMSNLALYSVYVTGSRIRNMNGDPDGARRDAEAALQEAINERSIAEHAIALTMLGRIAEDIGDWVTAESWYQRAVDKREIHRDQLGLQDWSLSRFATMQAPYRGLVRARVELGDVSGALTILDQTRARHLRDLKAHIQLRELLDPETRQTVYAHLDSLGHIREAESLPQSSTALASLALERSKLQAEIERLTGPLPSTDDSLDVAALRQQLGDRTLVAYAIDEIDSIAFVVRPDTVLAVRLGAGGPELSTSIRGIGPMWSGAAPDPAFSLRALHRLYQSLVEPIRPLIEGTRVIVIPGVELAGVPFGMLTTAPSEDYATAPYLVHDWAVSTELAAALLTQPSGAEADQDLDLLVMGRSQFDSGFTWNDTSLADLPDVRTEVGRIAAYGRTREVHLDEEAGEAIYQRSAPRSRIVHLASHAEANASAPLNSRIALAPDDEDDGTLHLYEILTTPLSADLVVLSGCSTADGKGSSGEGIVGLQYGMRAAGAAATLATLWGVADGTMSELTSSFYRHLADGQDKDQALRSAQLAYLANHDGIEASPFFWAAPVLSGDPSAIPLTRRVGPGWMWVLGVGALAVGVAWRLRLRTADV